MSSVTREAISTAPPGDVNADLSINSLDTVLLANQIIQNSNSVAGGNPDCNQDFIEPELDDTVCIANNFSTRGETETYTYDANGRRKGVSSHIVASGAMGHPCLIVSLPRFSVQQCEN